jgi:hypothetical protein
VNVCHLIEKVTCSHHDVAENLRIAVKQQLKKRKKTSKKKQQNFLNVAL